MTGTATASLLVSGNIPSAGVLTLVSVLVVFTSLLVLYGAYSLVGKIFTRKKKPEVARKPRFQKKGSKYAKEGLGDINPEVAAAIALALSQGEALETEAAIALALDMYLSESVHDQESYRLTIKKGPGAWGVKGQTFRQLPARG